MDLLQNLSKPAGWARSIGFRIIFICQYSDVLMYALIIKNRTKLNSMEIYFYDQCITSDHLIFLIYMLWYKLSNIEIPIIGIKLHKKVWCAGRNGICLIFYLN